VVIDFFGRPVEVGAVVATTLHGSLDLVFGVVEEVGPGGVAVKLPKPFDGSLLRRGSQVIVAPQGNDVD
jgi:hypothetical protein